MRFTDSTTFSALAPYALALLVAWFGFGVPAAVAGALVVALAGIALGLRGFIHPADTDLIELHTITYSHYVEKVRWCLDRTGLAYREVPSIGILGLLLTARTVPLLSIPASRTSIGDSPKILRFLWGAFSAVLEPGRCDFLAPTPEALEMEKRFDSVLGINVRVWSYWHLLRQRDLTLLLWGVNETTIPRWQRTLLPIVHPVLAASLRVMLGVSEARAASGLAATKQVFAEVDVLLADGRPYLLGGDALTFVDITFASLAALALFPENYGGDAVSMRKPPIEMLPAAWRKEVEALRDTTAGQFVMKLYREERIRRDRLS